MKLMTKLLALAVLLQGITVYAFRPAPELSHPVYIEGYIESVSFSTGTTPTVMRTIMVDSVKIYVSSQTVIKTDLGEGKPEILKVGTKVAIYGYSAKGGVMARTIYVFGK